MTSSTAPRHLAVIGGLGQLAGADLYSKLVETVSSRGTAARYRLTLERHQYDRGAGAGTDTGTDPERIGNRKRYLYDITTSLEQCQADGVLLPCFVSHTFLNELQAEVHVPILNIMTALVGHLSAGKDKLGVLCTEYVRDKKLFEQYFPADRLCYPSLQTQVNCITPVIYSPDGVLAGHTEGPTQDKLHLACLDLLKQGARWIVPGSSEIAVLAQALRRRGLPVVDSHQVYVDHVLAQQDIPAVRAFKIGIIGGIGPAATIDFMQKIIKNTSAQRDQDHIRMIVEHNPQIPDRTANLIGFGTDPTLALYSACKRLEANGAALIAMPCNTAHAYVPRLQPGLSIPIVNMLSETVRHIADHYAGHAKVGLLATSGTVSSLVYHEAARNADFDMLVPDAPHQALVMDAIYGKQGVKAGFIEGPCKTGLLQALAHLVERGASIVILGCTELPLLLPEHDAYRVGDGTVVLLDPTAILARRCVALAAEANHNGRLSTSRERLLTFG